MVYQLVLCVALLKNSYPNSSGTLSGFTWNRCPECSGILKSEENVLEVSLPPINLIDIYKTPWEQILEFRKDINSKAMLQRFRIFAYDNYTNKSPEYIEDDILKRMFEYDETIKRWGFDTRNGVLSTILTSKILAGTFSGSLYTSLIGESLASFATALGGVSVEMGILALNIKKRRHDLSNVLQDNPISYVVQIKDNFTCPSQKQIRGE